MKYDIISMIGTFIFACTGKRTQSQLFHIDIIAVLLVIFIQNVGCKFEKINFSIKFKIHLI